MAGSGGGQQGRDRPCSLTWGLSGRRQPGPALLVPQLQPVRAHYTDGKPRLRQSGDRLLGVGGGQPNGLSAGLSGGPKRQFSFSASTERAEASRQGGR